MGWHEVKELLRENALAGLLWLIRKVEPCRDESLAEKLYDLSRTYTREGSHGWILTHTPPDKERCSVLKDLTPKDHKEIYKAAMERSDEILSGVDSEE